MDLNTKLIRKNECITADMNGSSVTMDLNTGKYYNMGRTGGFIWNHLESAKTVEELMKEAMDAYSISEDVCREDILPFLETLLEKGLLTVVE